mgnify:FL=1|uniref:Uncharacterized protein n=1 Tax=Siphoviridae sp. ctamP19 TaxID=2827896 RepID=A0A8S5TNC2_9CAUD|nr:MAG TPA: hypothetical protein [Siphoviridae sp. ctamP19]
MNLILSFFLPLLSFVFSTIAFLFTLKNEYNKKFNLQLQVLDENISEWKIDRFSTENPDNYFQYRYRLFPNVVITNNSSIPVTINSFSLNDKYKFSIFTNNAKHYSVTIETNSTKKDEITFYSVGKEKKIEIALDNNNVLKPVITIAPFESVTGLLFFMFDESLIGKNTITVYTSRGNKEFPLTISSQYNSVVQTGYVPPL